MALNKLEQINQDYVRKEAAQINEFEILNTIKRIDFIRSEVKSSRTLYDLLDKFDKISGFLKLYSKHKDQYFAEFQIACFALKYIESDADLVSDHDTSHGHSDDELVLRISFDLLKEKIDSIK